MTFTKEEVEALLHALYDAEDLNLTRKQMGRTDCKPDNFLRSGNEPINTAFDKLLNLKYNIKENKDGYEVIKKEVSNETNN